MHFSFFIDRPIVIIPNVMMKLKISVVNYLMHLLKQKRTIGRNKTFAMLEY